MKYLALFLYLISYMSGIGAVTLLVFYYMKTRIAALKYFILADVFCAFGLFFDTLNLYSDLFIKEYPIWLEVVKINGLLFSAIGVVYFFTLSTYHILGFEVTKRMKVLYFVISIALSQSIITVMCISFLSGMIAEAYFLHSAYFIATFISTVGSGYNLVLIIMNLGKINSLLKQFFIVFAAVDVIIVSASIFSNTIQFWYPLNFPLAFSPVSYFLLNLVVVIFAFRNLKHINFIQTRNDLQEGLKKPDLEELLKEYGLTQREKEIIQLILDGLGNREIGDRLYITANTARNHIYSIYRKLGIKNRYGLMSLVAKKS